MWLCRPDILVGASQLLSGKSRREYNNNNVWVSVYELCYVSDFVWRRSKSGFLAT